MLPKTVFPSLLQKLFERSQDRISKNVRSGFSASGIIPCDPHQVLHKVRKYEKNTTNQNDMLESFSEVMSGVVAIPQTATARPKRKSKINVAAGKSVSLNDLSEKDGPNHSTLSPSSPENAITSTDSESESDKNETEEDTDDDTTKTSDTKVPATQDNIQEGSFILVDFLYNKGTKKEVTKTFVAQVKKLKKQSILVSCLRPHKGKKDKFVFPDVEDEIDVNMQQIKFILLCPSIIRGVHFFVGLN